MTQDQWIGLGCLVLLVSFVVFAFRQGIKVNKDAAGTPSGYPGEQPHAGDGPQH